MTKVPSGHWLGTSLHPGPQAKCQKCSVAAADAVAEEALPVGPSERDLDAAAAIVKRPSPSIEDAYLQFLCPECKGAQLHVVMLKLYGDIWAICRACNVQFLIKVS